MLDIRVIPLLLLRRKGLVKTTKFRRPQYVGDPINIVRIFNEKEVDELILTDIVASREGHRPDLALLEEIAGEAFMPVGYGGGVRSVADAKALLRIGIEKVSVNTGALEDSTLIERLAGELGSQCVIASVDVRRTIWGEYRVHSHANAKVAVADPMQWIAQLVGRGAGEILLNAVDRDGTMAGYDLDLLKRLRGRFDVPIIPCGGASTLDNMRAALRVSGVSALGVGARFVYEGPHRAVLVSYLSRDDIAGLSVELSAVS